MKIEMRKVLVRDLVAGYKDEQDLGVVGYGGRLNIRPPYQREFVYSGPQRAAVIRSVRHQFPINVMYWSKTDGLDAYEILDGQQRTISICQFLNSVFSIPEDHDPNKPKYFHGLTQAEKDAILDYELHVYVCEGTDRERLDWFKIINIAGEKLTDQELRNAVYAGPWLTDAKKFFSRTGGPAAGLGGDYMTGKAIRQELLEKALHWISKGKIEDYMAKHQQDPTAQPLKIHFQNVITWVSATFEVHRDVMRSVDWGPLYDAYHDAALVPQVLEARIDALMKDDEIDRKAGIYPYVLDGDERHLNLRAFSTSMKQTAYARQNEVCPACTKSFKFSEMEGDHIDPWHSGGKTNAENCQMLCKPCNRRKSGK